MPHLKSLPDPSHLSDLFERYPQGAAPLMEFTDMVLRAEGELSIAERELIATFVSGLNACDFCFQSHKAYALAFGIEERLIDELVVDIESAAVNEKLKPLLRYVKKLDDAPSRLVSADAEAVYTAGWSEKALYEAVQVCALFNMMNRIVQGTGVNFDYVATPERHPTASGAGAAGGYSYAGFGKRAAEGPNEAG